MSDSITTAIVSYVSLALGVIGLVVGAVNHKRIRSTCCGVEKSISLDIESTTPPAKPTITTESA